MLTSLTSDEGSNPSQTITELDEILTNEQAQLALRTKLTPRSDQGSSIERSEGDQLIEPMKPRTKRSRKVVDESHPTEDSITEAIIPLNPKLREAISGSTKKSTDGSAPQGMTLRTRIFIVLFWSLTLIMAGAFGAGGAFIVNNAVTKFVQVHAPPPPGASVHHPLHVKLDPADRELLSKFVRELRATHSGRVNAHHAAFGSGGAGGLDQGFKTAERLAQNFVASDR